jgi:hypothetical protein
MSWDVQHVNNTKSDTFPDEMQVNFHMLGALMLDGVGVEEDNADVVTIDEAC